MEHIETATGDLYLFEDTPVHLYRWPMDEDRYTRAELAITPEYQEKEKILNGTLGFLPLTVGKIFKPRMETWQNEDPRKSADNMFASLDEGFKAAENNKDPILERAYQLDIRMEQSPNPNSRVTLGREKDALGVPLVHLNWELTSLEKYSARVITELVAKSVGEAGVGRIQLREFLRDPDDHTFPDNTNGGWHHMGTTRMSADPKKGVVDANCKVHDIENLYVAGAGCFATSGAPNPTLTLIALSLRLSDHLKKTLNHNV